MFIKTEIVKKITSHKNLRLIAAKLGAKKFVTIQLTTKVSKIFTGCCICVNFLPVRYRVSLLRAQATKTQLRKFFLLLKF